LHSAIEKGKKDEVRSLLESRVDPNLCLGTSGLRPLHRAISHFLSTAVEERTKQIRRNRIAIITLLIGAGADLDSLNEEGLAPIHRVVVQPGLESTLSLLCEMGAQVNLRGNRGKTALHWAAVVEPREDRSFQHTVKRLVAFGADVNARDENDRTPLSCAVNTGCAARVSELLDYGADVGAVDSMGRSVLAWAVYRDQPLMVKTLCDHGAWADATVDTSTKSPWTCLQYAANKGRIETARILLNAGADVNGYSGERTPLLGALRQPDADVEMVELLLRRGADVKAPSQKTGRLPIHFALSDPSILALVLQAGSPIDPVDKDGQTPLVRALRDGQDESASMLIENGADIDHSADGSETPLWIAISQGNKPVVNQLLEHGALVAGYRNAENGANYMHLAAYMGSISVIRLLLAHGGEIEAEAFGGITPLFEAVSGDN
jgi:ankyrin